MHGGAFALAAYLSFLSCVSSTLGYILAIDYGTDWTKALLVEPGETASIIPLNGNNEKIYSSISMNATHCMFGEEAYDKTTWLPKDSFQSLKYILGTQYLSDRASYYNQVGQAEILETDRGTVGVSRRRGRASWSVEELVALQLRYLKSLAEKTAGESIEDVIITVPSFFSVFERQALLDAVDLAELNCIRLIQDGAAIAMKYATVFPPEHNTYNIVYDAGAGSIRATLVSLEPSASTSGNIQVKVKATAWTRRASGNELTRRIKQLWIRQFEELHGWTIDGDAKPLSKLWREAERVKALLSAVENADQPVIVSVDRLVYDIDFSTNITRSDHERACDDIKPLFLEPINDCLKSAGLTWDDIASVIMTGGHSSTPMVLEAMREAVGEHKINQNLDVYTAAVSGAAIEGVISEIGQNKSTIEDSVAYNILAAYEDESEPSQLTETLVFDSTSKLGSTSVLVIEHCTKNFNIRLSYKSAGSSRYEGPADFTEIQVIAVPRVLGSLRRVGVSNPIIKVALSLSEAGFVYVEDVVALGTSTEGNDISFTLVWNTKQLSIRPLTSEEKHDFKKRVLSAEISAVPPLPLANSKPSIVVPGTSPMMRDEL